jgi:penicillin-binding protein 2
VAGDKIGKSGVESAFDRYLRGRSGVGEFRVDALGRPQGAFQLREDAKPGDAIRLTLDIGLQRAAERALREGIEIARENKSYNADGGAIVALDPRDGAIRAMASSPTYKPSIFSGRVDPRKITALTKPEANNPLLNRATDGLYPPGSTFKPIVALAAMQDRVLSPYQYIQCTPYSTFGLDKFVFRNWNPFTNQAMDLSTALAQSCDTYFYEVGNRYYERGPEWWSRLQDWARRFGFGQSPELDIGNGAAGLLPTPEWRKRTFKTAWDRAWNPGELIQLAIGQKDLLVTPLQMARFYALIANGGKLVTPYLVSAVEQPGSNGSPSVTLTNFAPKPPKNVGVDPAAVAAVQRGLFAATQSTTGTSYGVFGNFEIPISGKTGTAEKVVQIPGYPVGHKEDQSWWCGYGPSDDAKLVVCAMIENGGHGSTAAAPAALRVFEHYFDVKAKAVSIVRVD